MKGSFSFLLILILTVSVSLSQADDEEATTKAPLSQRIRDAIYNSIRTLGNVVRFVPATITDSLRNISRTSSEALRRNSSINLIRTSEATSSPAPPTSSGAPQI